MIIQDLHTSVLRLCDDFRQGVFPEHDLTVIDFDAHADDTTMPATDVVGISSMAAETDVFTEMMILFGISTYQDPQLVKLKYLISKLYETLLPESRFKVYNSSTGLSRGMMVVQSGTRLMPMSSSNARPTQYIGVTFSTDCFKQP